MALAHCITEGHTPTDLHEADPKRFPDCFNSVAALSARVPEVLGEHYAISYPGYQWQTSRDLRQTPLHTQWVAEQAHFGQFSGWERPLFFKCKKAPELTFGKPDWFDQVGQEVNQAHNAAAVFDQSSFGKIRVEGADAESFLNRLCANNMCKPAGRAMYTAMLNERGGFESDLTALRLADDCYRLYVGTAALKRDMTWLKRHLHPKERVTIKGETQDFAVLGLMGPDTAHLIKQLGAPELNDLKYFHHIKTEIAGEVVTATRLSYVGESGWEITCRANSAPVIYKAMVATGIKPAGLFAQSAMRIEKQFLSYGSDLDADINPLQAGLDFAIDWHSEFIGKGALLTLRDQPLKSKMVSIILEDADAVPLGNEPVYLDGKIIGKTTSASFGYRVMRPVALAYLTITDGSLDGQAVQIDIARENYTGIVSYKPAFDPRGQRMKIA